MVICVPLFAVIYDTLKKLVYQGLKNKQQLQVWEEYKEEFGEQNPLSNSPEPETEKAPASPDETEVK